MSVCLLHMPYAALERPSLALGLLKSGLERCGVPVTIYYANWWWAEELSLTYYQHISDSAAAHLMGEWTFAQAAFDHAGGQDYLDRVLDPYPPAHRVLIREAAETARHKAEVFLDEVADRVLEGSFKLVGCSSTFQQNCASLGLLRRLKEENPDLITVMGGANSEGPMARQMVKSFPYLDLAVSGEADLSFPELCRRIVEEGLPAPEQLPPGIVHLDTPGVTTPRGTVKEMDKVPVPNYDEYFETRKQSRLRRAVYPGIAIETSRGCWWGQKHHCTFCGLNGGGMVYRSKSPDRVVAEFRKLHRAYKLRRFEVMDNILDMKHIKTVLPRLAGKRYLIFYETKANLKRAQLETLQKAGVLWIQPGIESLSDAVLELMNKGNTAAMNVDLLRNCRELGISVEWSILYGFPGERDEDYAEAASWLPAISHLQPPLGMARIRYDRFSPYHTNPEAYEVRLRPFWSYQHCYPLEDSELMELAYFFEDDGPGPRGRCPVENETRDRPGLTAMREHVDRWMSRTAILTMTQEGENLRIQDTRPMAEAEVYHLEGLEAALCRACDTTMTLKSLAGAVGRPGNDQELGQALERLHRLGLILKIGERYVRVATAPQVPQHPGGFPGGSVVLEHAREPELDAWRLKLAGTGAAESLSNPDI